MAIFSASNFVALTRMAGALTGDSHRGRGRFHSVGPLDLPNIMGLWGFSSEILSIHAKDADVFYITCRIVYKLYYLL